MSVQQSLRGCLGELQDELKSDDKFIFTHI